MIRTRLTIWNCLVLSIILTLTGLAIYITTSRSIYQGVDDNLLQRARFFAVGMGRGPRPPNNDSGNNQRRNPPPNERPISAEEARSQGIDPAQIKQIEVMRNALRPMIFGLDGKDIMHPENRMWDRVSFETAKSGQQAFGSTTLDGVKLRVLSFPVRADGKVKEVMQLASPMAAEEQQLTQLAKTLLIVLPLAVVVMLFIGVALTRQALRPVAHIAAAAEQIEASNLSDRLPVLGKDEFAQLSTTFNGMLARLKTAFDDIDAAYARQRRFTADASHELKTPLTAIQARTGIALMRDLEPAQYRDHLLAIDRASGTMNSIVQDLLLLAASDEGQLVLRPEEVRVADLVDDAVSSVDSSQHSFVVDVPASLVLKVDPLAMTRVLVNLIQNSVLYTEQGKEIRIAASSDTSICTIRISDQGEGIPADDVPLIFERFHRVDQSRDRHSGGSGLGLSIAQAIVESHDGTIGLESELHVGTTVTISLPV